MENNGLTISPPDRWIDRVEKRTTELRLVAKAGGLEVMRQTIRSGALFGLSPAAQGAVEHFTILSGECMLQGPDGEESTHLGPGHTVTAKDLDANVYFKALTDIELIYVSTQPVFSFLSDQIGELIRLAQTVEETDHQTAEHLQRMQKHSTMIGERLGLPPHRMEHLIHAAILHDVGKAAVPAEILAKPGPLTPGETEIMRKHPVTGAEMVARTYLKDTATIILQHHERYAGGGYPCGNAWPDFTLEAAIIACVDTYDAMTSNRPYRPAMSPVDAAKELVRCRGTQLHPQVVDALLDVLRQENVLPAVRPAKVSRGRRAVRARTKAKDQGVARS